MAASEKIKKLKETAVNRSHQRAEMKRELAVHAIQSLAQLGYARTSLRDIASQAGRSVGAISYYFEDKIDLISYCVRLYKEDFVTRTNEIFAQATDPETIVDGFTELFVQSVSDDAETHRLWYDIRSQALFDEGFHSVVFEIEAALIEMIGRLMESLGLPVEKKTDAYYLLDSCFRVHLQKKLAGHPDVDASFRTELHRILEFLRVSA